MKRTMILTGLLIAGMFAANGYAQYGSGMMHGGMMGGGMMGGGMMNNYGMGQMMGGYGYGMGQGMMQGMMGYTYQLGSAAFFLQNRNYLGLNDAQVARLNTIQREEVTNTSQKTTDLQLAQLQLNDLVSSPQPDKSAIQSKIREIQELRGDLMVTEVEYAFNARSVLNPQQLALTADLTGAGYVTSQPGVQGGMGGGMRMQNQ